MNLFIKINSKLKKILILCDKIIKSRLESFISKRFDQILFGKT